MKIIVILRKQFAGCGFYRMYQPHNHLAKNYGVEVLITNGLSQFTDDKLKEFDLVIWHKAFYDFKDIERAKSLGLVTVADFDDHWILPNYHIFYKSYMKQGNVSSLHRLICKVDHITCTTEMLAEEIYKHNRSVEVFENAMDMNYPGCKVERIKEDSYVFGYLGGHTHRYDVKLLEEVSGELKGSYKLRLFGYDGTDIYKYYASVLSDKGRNDNFQLYKGADIWHYPQFYNYMDCSLVPLESSHFNSMKSPLKLVEAGFFKKAVIVSPVEPYLDLSKYCLTAETKQQWIDNCKKLIKSPDLGKELGLKLYQAVQKFSIEKINKRRIKFYEDVLKNKSMDSSREPCRMVAV